MTKPFLFLIFGMLCALQANAQRLFDIQELVTLFEMRQPEQIDRQVKQFDSWYYISSEGKPNGDQVDMWMLEKEDHEIIAVLLSVRNPNEPSGTHNQFQLHLKNEAEFQRVLNQARGVGFQRHSDKGSDGQVAVTYYQSTRYLLVAQVSPNWSLPFRLMITYRADTSD